MTQERQAYHHGDLRNGLLDAADQVLQEEGLQGFTLRACARRAGVSHAAPKHHFTDVRGLLSAVAERGFARLVALLEQRIGEVLGDLDQEMLATSNAYLEFAQTYPEHFRIMFRSDLICFDMDAPPDPVRRTFIALTNVILRQRGEAELDAGSYKTPRRDSLINDILIGWCHVHGYAHLRLEGQLNMVEESEHQAQLSQCSLRLAHLIQRASDPAAKHSR